MQFVTARGWEDLSYLISSYEKLSVPVDEEVIHQFLQHEDVAKMWPPTHDLYQKYKDDYDISRISPEKSAQTSLPGSSTLLSTNG